MPETLPLVDLDWERLTPHLSKAMVAIGRYDGALHGIINKAVLLSPITNQEAILSSAIEGTQTSLTEVLKHEAGDSYTGEKEIDINEVVNYRRALLTAELSSTERPLSLQFIREMHAQLMRGVRGQNKSPGAFRTEQNWIGTPGTLIEDARFVPPSIEVMRDALINLEEYIAYEEKDALVQMAIVHAQFEIIHPFDDGNGRLGRMLIPFFLYRKNVLQRPVFYLSEYLEANDDEYRDRLLAVTNGGKWHEWIEFFLIGVEKQSVTNTQKAEQIHALYEEMKQVFTEVTKSRFAVGALDAFFSRPIVNTTAFLELAKIDLRATGSKLLRNLVELGPIEVLRKGSGQRPSIYMLPKLINIAEGREVF